MTSQDQTVLNRLYAEVDFSYGNKHLIPGFSCGKSCPLQCAAYDVGLNN
jgi:hypothetical protein